ncbi:MAG: UpxY family transcription antiterminator [bacterium]
MILSALVYNLKILDLLTFIIEEINISSENFLKLIKLSNFMNPSDRVVSKFYSVSGKSPFEFSNKAFWYVIHVRSRHEFKVLERLTETGINTFLPVVEKLNRWKDRKKLVKFPLFPGYLFVNMLKNPQNVLNVLKTTGVVKFLGIKHGEPEPVPEEQIIFLRRIVESREPLDPYPYLKEGQRVRIKKGPLSGVEGVLSKRSGQHILIISVDVLMHGASLKIDASDVEKI